MENQKEKLMPGGMRRWVTAVVEVPLGTIPISSPFHTIEVAVKDAIGRGSYKLTGLNIGATTHDWTICGTEPPDDQLPDYHGE